MTKIDCLIEVAKKLKEARNLGERSSDRALLYFIDMTLAHVCDQLDARSEAKRRREQSGERRQSRCVSVFGGVPPPAKGPTSANLGDRLKLDRRRLASEFARPSPTPAQTQQNL